MLRLYKSIDVPEWCSDKHDQCEGWAANQECANNPNFMLNECALSCTVSVTLWGCGWGWLRGWGGCVSHACAVRRRQEKRWA
jgi:hypothetical protein